MNNADDQAWSAVPTPEEISGRVGSALAEEPGDTLAAKAIAGDEGAMRQLWNEHRRWVAAVLMAHMPRNAELDDLLQEVAMAVVAKISGLRDAAAFKPWLRAVAISIAKTNARRVNVRKAGWMRIASFAGAEEPEERLVGPGQRETLREGRKLMEIATDLPDGYREPLLLKCVQGMSYRQIGRVMGVPETTVETRIARARRMLRERAIQAGVGPREESGRDEEPVAARMGIRTDQGSDGDRP